MGDWPVPGAKFGTPANPLGTAGAPGTSGEAVATDATIPAFNDGANPSASNPSDSGTTGTDPYGARRDHRHAREARRVLLMDDFKRQVTTSPNNNFLTNRHFDDFPWVQEGSSGGASLKDSRSAADATFPDTGILVFDISTGTTGVVGTLSSGDTSVDALNFWDSPRDGTKYFIGFAVPAATEMFCHWGIAYTGGGNDYDPDGSVDLVFYKSATHAYDFNFSGGKTVTYHSVGDHSDFIALRIMDGAGNADVYGISTASAFIIASSVILVGEIAFALNAGNYDITGSVSGGVGSVTATGIAPTKIQGWFRMGARVPQGVASTGHKMYVDYVISDRPIPVGVL